MEVPKIGIVSTFRANREATITTYTVVNTHRVHVHLYHIDEDRRKDEVMFIVL